MKFKLIYLICMILCVFLTFSTVSAVDLSDNSIDLDTNSAVLNSQSESSITNLNENTKDIRIYSEDKDCVDSVNELSNLENDDIGNSNSNLNSLDYDDIDKQSNLNSLNQLSVIDNGSNPNSINSDEKSLKSSLSSINSDNTDYDSNLNDNDDIGLIKSNIVTASSSTFKDLQNLINNASVGSTINLDGKTFVGNGTVITINKAITINGGSSTNLATLDAHNLSDIFYIKSDNVHLTNCNFINANARGVLFDSSDSSVTNCNFNNNYRHLTTRPLKENFLVENCNFTNGFSLDGSVVYILVNNSTVKNCNFMDNLVENHENKQGHGAALQIGGSDNLTNLGYVINCTFINNTVICDTEDTHAGALCFRPGIKVINTTFIDNYCNKIGGATTLHSDGEIINCTFINNRAGEYGGAISTGFQSNNISVNITNCTFINNSAPMGGAIQIKGNNVKVTNSIFEENKASESEGGSVFIAGNDAMVINSTFKNNFAKSFGAGVLINGSNAIILNSSFDNNLADYGAAVYVIGSNANLFSSNFTNHTVKNGTVFIKGINTYVYDSKFSENLGENGAGLYIEGSNLTLISSDFELNNASKKGGAVYIEGSNANLIMSQFLNNNAIPDISDIGSGLGGAIYIKGDNNTIDSSLFNFNTARNGSAIYTDGLNMVLSNTNFDKNQAWSYVLDSMINPSLSYFNQSDIKVNLTLIGGNNIANAIYNTVSVNNIYFYNVSYISSKGPKTTGEDEIHPVNGAQNSNDGALLYQDDREDNQLVNIIIYRDSNNDPNILSASNLDEERDSNEMNPIIDPDDVILNKTFTTGILGDISFNLSSYIDEPLEAGKYRLYAQHYEDDYYKEIDTNDDFEILPLVDVSIDIESAKDYVEFNKTVKFTIKIQNNGPNNATEVNVDAILPDGLKYVSSSPSVGTYDHTTGIWSVGNLNVGENQTLSINTRTNAGGIIDFPVNVSSFEDDSNKTNNYDNKSIKVPVADLAINVEASKDSAVYGDNIDWTITVVNNGPDNSSKIVVFVSDLDSDDLIYLNCSNASFNGTSSKWEIPKLVPGEELSLVISTKINSSNKDIAICSNVSADTLDPVDSNNFDSDSVKVLPLCDLAIDINVLDNPANKGDEIIWEIVVVNDGPDDAGDVSVSLSDLESLGLEFVDASDDSFDPETNQWLIGDLPNGENATLTITTKANISNETVNVEAIVNTSTYEMNKENNMDNASLTVNPICDLAIDITVSDNPVNMGDIVVWEILVVNDGPDGATDVSVSLSDLESLGLEFVDASDDSFDSNANKWIIGDLGNGETAKLNISTRVSKSNDNITLNSSVKTSTFESDYANNMANETLNVLPSCDMEVNIIPDNNVSHEGEIVNWIVNVTNNGPDTASDVTIENILPDDLEYIISEISKGSLVNNEDDNNGEDNNDGDSSLNWNIGDLETGESVILVISTKTLDEGLILNNVSVNTSTHDLNESNNFDSASVDVVPLEDNDDNSSDNSDNSDNGTDSENDPDSKNDDYNDSNNSDNAGSDNTDDYGDDYLDYLDLDDLLNSSDADDSDNSVNHDSNSSKINNHKNSKAKSSEDLNRIPMKKSGNPLAVLILSICALFSLFYRKF